MKESMISYWGNRLKDQHKDLRVNDYIVHVAIIDKTYNQGINKWISCKNLDEVESLLQCVVIPSCQISRGLMDRNTGQLYFDSTPYDETISLLDSISINYNLIHEYQECYRMVDSYTGQFENLKYLENEIMKNVDYTSNIKVKVKLYENVKSAGLGLIEEYKQNQMTDKLEENTKFSVSELEDIFNNIDNNEFLVKRITPMLNDLNML